MEEKNQIKITLKTAILLFVIILIVIALIIVFILSCNKNNTITLKNPKNYEEITIDGKLYYQKLNTNTWSGDYHQEKFYMDYIENKPKNITEVVSYSDYLEYINLLNSVISNEIKPYYSNENCNYILLSYADGARLV